MNDESIRELISSEEAADRAMSQLLNVPLRCVATVRRRDCPARHAAFWRDRLDVPGRCTGMQTFFASWRFL